MNFDAVADVAALEQIYGKPGETSLVKVAESLTPEYRALILASPFFALATSGPEGLDCSPRGERGGAFVILDDKTIAIPDWRGNNRMDSLRNIVRDPEIAMLFLVPGSVTTVRLNGTAIVTIDEELCASMERDGKKPRSAIVVSLRQIYFQCGRAVLRAGLWDAAYHIDADSIPTPGDVLRSQTEGRIDGNSYDAEWASRADKTMW